MGQDKPKHLQRRGIGENHFLSPSLSLSSLKTLLPTIVKGQNRFCVFLTFALIHGDFGSPKAIFALQSGAGLASSL